MKSLELKPLQNYYFVLELNYRATLCGSVISVCLLCNYLGRFVCFSVKRAFTGVTLKLSRFAVAPPNGCGNVSDEKSSDKESELFYCLNIQSLTTAIHSRIQLGITVYHTVVLCEWVRLPKPAIFASAPAR